MNTVRVLLSLAANFSWDLHQYDVKNAFLHGDLEEEIYMEIPLEFEETLRVNKVCKLQKHCMVLNNPQELGLGGLLR